MAQRIDYSSIVPGALKGMYATNAYFDTCSFDQKLRRLVELRVSQINGCSYCIDLHRKQLLDLGDDEARLDVLPEWRQSNDFSAAERAALDWAEAVTEIPDREPSADLFAALTEHFDAARIVDLTAIIANMNALNRMAISLGH